MARPEKPVRGRACLARDSQQWMLDYLIQETGKVFHFQGDGRGRLPRSVRSHGMISKHVGLQARRQAGKPLRHPGQVLYVEANSARPNSPTVARKRQWYKA